jgi:SAM-dependent methyltransferase
MAYQASATNGIYDSSKWRKWLPSPSVNLAHDRVLRRLGQQLATGSRARVLVVGSGRQRDNIRAALASDGATELEMLCADVDATADVDVFADAHNLPFEDRYFDAVITTAVLEHVLYPEVVAGEMARVLEIGGLMYSELPFLQHVHEGAYDFTRYTLSGHRRLLNHFTELDSGLVAGPGTVLVWALESFFGSFFANVDLARLARLATRLATFWLKYFDYFLKDKPAAMDGASCSYFFGKKIEGTIGDADIIAAYQGSRHIVHQ